LPHLPEDAMGVRFIGEPQPGFFKLRLVRGGPWVSAAIFYPCPIEGHPEIFQWLDRPRRLAAEIDGHEADPMRVWLHGRMIPRSEYLFLRDDAQWAKRYAPNDPKARPKEAIDLNAMQPLF
jgi:hypothetical protein